MEAQRQLGAKGDDERRDDARAECAEALRRCESLINEQRAACADRDDISHQLREAVCSRDAATEEGSRVRAELAVAQQEISSLREIVAEREQQLESDALRASKTIEEATQGRLAEREESKTLIEAGEKRLSEAEEYINALMAKNADLNNEILALGNDRDEARAYVEATTARVQELQLKISCLEDDMQMERQRVREAKAEQARADGAASDLQKLVDERNSEISTLRYSRRSSAAQSNAREDKCTETEGDTGSFEQAVGFAFEAARRA